MTAQDDSGNTDTIYAGTVGFTSSDSTASYVPASSMLTGGIGVFSGILRTAGGQTLTASDGSINGTSGTITVSAAAATHFGVGTPATATAGGAFGFTVTALDPFGNTANSYSGTLVFSSSDSSGAVPINSTMASGVAIFTATLRIAGNQTLKATDLVQSTIAGTSSGVAVSAAAATHFVVSAPAHATAGAGFLFTITAQDAFNNTATGYSGTTTLASSDSAVSVSPNSTLAAGVGRFSATLDTAGQQTLLVNDSAVSSTTAHSNAIVVSAATASHFAVTAPVTGTAGTALTFTVTALDAFNNTATSYLGAATFSSTDSGVGVTLPAGPATLASGVGSFSATLITAGSQTLQAMDGLASSITGVSNTITASTAAASHFAVAAPAAVTAGSAFSFTVTALDKFNNTAVGYSGTMVFSASDSGATMPADGMLAGGVGVFSTTLIAAGGQSLSATAAGLPTLVGTSNLIAVTGAAATHFTVTAPASASAGIGFSITVQALDQYNNTATGYEGIVAFSTSDSTASLPTPPTTLVAGIGIFSVTLATLGSQTVAATDTALATITGTSNAITVNRPPATHFAVSASPTSITAGNAFSFTVTALDQFNHTAVDYAGSVTFSTSDAGLGVSLPTPPVLLNNGVGVFSATLVTAGSQTLTTTDAVTSGIIGSTTVSITAAAATQFAVSAPPFVIATRAFPFTVTAEDPFGNTDTNYAGTAGFISSDGTPGSAVPIPSTLANGVGIFRATLVTAGTQSLTATDTQTQSIGGSTTIAVPVSMYIPSATTGRDTVVTVPINVSGLNDPNSPLQQSGLSGGTFVLLYDPSVFTVSEDDVQLGTIRSPSAADPSGTAPGDGYAPNPNNVQDGANNGWQVGTLPSSGPGVFIVTLTNNGFLSSSGIIPLTGTGGGTLVTVNFHVLTNAPVGTTMIDLAADNEGGLPTTSLSDAVDNISALQPYDLLPAPEDNTSFGPYSYTGFDPVDGAITVTGTNLSPVAVGDSYRITERAFASDPSLAPPASSGVLANDTNPQNITLTASLVSPPAHGSVTVNSDGSFIYTPTTGYVGTDSFNYAAGDGFHSTVATVSLTVTARLSIPTNIIGSQGGVVTVPVNLDNPNPAGSGGLVGASLAIDYDPAVLTFVSAQGGPAYGAGWDVEHTVNQTSGLLGVTLLNTSGTPNVSTAGGALVLLTFDINANAASGITPINLVPSNTPGSITVTTGLTAKTASYSMPPRPLPTNASNDPGVDGSVTVSGGLMVTSFTPTPTGFTVTFNKPFNPSTVNLYTTGSLPDDVLLTPNTQISIRGSVVFTPPTNVGGSPTGFTFVKTATASALGGFNPASGLLAAGIYTVTLRSYKAGGSGFEDLLGDPLNGSGSGDLASNFVATFSVSAPPTAVGIPDFARGPSNTDAIYFAPTLTNGSTFALSYTNPAANPATGTTTVTFSTSAAILQSNIQAALSSGGLAAQIGTNAAANNTPNAVVIVTNDTSTGANVLITFQSALAQATNVLLTSSTPGVNISPATINVPNNIPGSGIPIALSSGLHVTSGIFTLQYNPALLAISGAISKIAGATFTLVSNDPAAGTAVLSLSSPTSISASAGPITLGSLLATVPLSATASYGAVQLLHFSSAQLSGTGGPLAVTIQDGIEVAAYFGDVTAMGGPLNLQDAAAIAATSHAVPNTAAQTIPGFVAFPNLDPVIIGDVSLQGIVNSTDAGAILQEVGGIARITIPYAPIGFTTPPLGAAAPATMQVSPGLHGQAAFVNVTAVDVVQGPADNAQWMAKTSDSIQQPLARGQNPQTWAMPSSILDQAFVNLLDSADELDNLETVLGGTPRDRNGIQVY